MPELPDLTVFAENLEKLIKGKRITALRVNRAARLKVSAEELSRALQGKEVAGVERAGKEIVFQVGQGERLFVHLMLTGGFVLGKGNEGWDRAILMLAFHDGSSLLMKDPKGLLTVSLNTNLENAAPDALDVSADDLMQLFGKKPKALAKAVLIDQKMIRGIGNAYADEILWEGRISPASVVGKIPPEAVEGLAGAMHSVLSEATGYLREHHPGIISGEIRDFLKVHNPSRSLSPTGRPIMKKQISSKTTYFTDEQKLYL